MKGDVSKPIPTRFSVPEIRRMDEIAKSSGLGTRATLIKFCVKVFMDDFETRGSRALPRDWESIMEALDNRSAASRSDYAKNLFRVAEKNGGSYGAKKPRRKRS
jgi:hypothetical protein